MTPLEVAISQVGQEEKPRGSNWGEPVKSYLASVGINFPASWCMAFVYWCFDQVRPNDNPLAKTGGVLHQWNLTKPENRFLVPQAGDIFIQDHGHGLGHTGFVQDVNGEVIHTIEGNTNDTGSREGYEVAQKVRRIDSCIGFIRFS